MPLTAKGNKIMSAMENEYGAEKGKKVFYASKNKGTISGVDAVGPSHIANAVGVDRRHGVRPTKTGRESYPGESSIAGRKDAETVVGEKQHARQEKEAEALDLPTQLDEAETELQKLERSQEQQAEDRELRNSIDDHKQHIRGLRDTIKDQARTALSRAGGAKGDALTEMERCEDDAVLMKKIDAAIDEVCRRMDAMGIGDGGPGSGPQGGSGSPKTIVPPEEPPKNDPRPPPKPPSQEQRRGPIPRWPRSERT